MIDVTTPDPAAAVQLAVQCVAGLGVLFGMFLGLVAGWAVLMRVLEGFGNASK